MQESITIKECEKLHLDQWVKVYGVFASRCDYLVTCQVYQLEAVLDKNPKSWWDDYALEPVDEEEQPIALTQAFLKSNNL